MNFRSGRLIFFQRPEITPFWQAATQEADSVHGKEQDSACISKIQSLWLAKTCSFSILVQKNGGGATQDLILEHNYIFLAYFLTDENNFNLLV